MSRREQLEEMLQADPGDPFLRYALAMDFATSGETAAAEARLSELIVDEPDYVAAYFQLGQLHANQADPVSAIDVLDKGIAVAVRLGDRHAEGEMREFRDMLSSR